MSADQTRRLQPRPHEPEPDVNPETFKTELCARWVAGFCPWDDKCRFAHGAEELLPRARPDR